MATNAKPASSKEKRGFLADVRKNRFSYLIALPALLYVLIFSYFSYPYMLIAFQKFQYNRSGIFDILFHGDWCGWDNFRFFFASQAAFRVTVNTIWLNILFIVTGTVASLLIALGLNELRCKWFVKTSQSVMLFPNYISWVVVSYILYTLFSQQYGLANKFLALLHMDPVNWYTTPGAWPWILVLMRVWKGAGMNAIIYLAAITGIDQTLYEAASIDGAGRFKLMTKITLPLITPMIVILTLLSVGKIMYGDFGMIYALVGDNGTLYSTTDIIDTYIFRALRQVGDPSQAMAMGLFQSAIGFVMVFGSNWITKRIYPEGALY